MSSYTISLLAWACGLFWNHQYSTSTLIIHYAGTQQGYPSLSPPSLPMTHNHLYPSLCWAFVSHWEQRSETGQWFGSVWWLCSITSGMHNTASTWCIFVLGDKGLHVSDLCWPACWMLGTCMWYYTVYVCIICVYIRMGPPGAIGVGRLGTCRMHVLVVCAG